MKLHLTFAAFVLASAPALAQEADPLDLLTSAIDETLREADEAVADAAEDLGRTGLRGRRAHARLGDLCEDLAYAATCSAIDADGVIVTLAPAPFTATEGRDVSDQPHVKRLLETREPVLSDTFRSVEGFDAVTLARPVFARDGRFLGSVSLMARPASLLGHAVKSAFPEELPDVHVLDRDGTLLYDPDTPGVNVFTDPRFDDFPDVQRLARRQVAEREGTGDYRFLGRGLTPPVQKRMRWETVGLHGTEWRATVIETLDGGAAPVVRYDEPAIPIPAQVGLDSLVTLVDRHLLGTAEDLEIVAASAAVRSGEWERIEAPLRKVAELNPSGIYFYAAADGSFWTLDRGKSNSDLLDRAYFHAAMQGERTIGELVVGKTKGRNEAVLAVPVRGDDGEIVGMIGGSLFMDDLSATIHDQMGLAEGLWFYAFDADHRLALYPDPERLFLRAGELGPEVEPWFAEMEQRGEGAMRYTYEGKPRTLVFKRSPVTGWTHAFGYVGEREPGA